MNLSIKKKLLFSNLANIVFIMAVGLIAYFAMQTLDRSMDAIQRNGETIKTQLQADQSHDALRADVLAAMLAGENNDQSEQHRVKQDANDHIAQFRKLVQKLETSVDDGPVRQAVLRVKPDMDAYLAACSQIVPLALTDLPAARRAYPQFMTVFRTLEKSMEELSDLIEKNSGSTKDQGDAALAAAHRNIVIVALAAAVVALALGLLMSRSITAPLDQAIAFAAHIAAGDLSDHLTLHPGDQTETGRLKQALQNMNDSLNGIVARVRAGTDTIATASGEIASGNLDLSSRTEQQASALEQTASSMEQLTATVKHNGDSARQADQLSRSASEVALRGGQVVANVVETMGAINQASNQIADIIGVIEGIAFQTNILALNAAVEAARAGEQGRGFAVVATEVRNLAHRSAAAAKEIKALIDTSVQRVGQGSTLVGQAGDTMQEIVVSVQRVTSMMGQIAAAGQEQEAGIGQINQAIAQMDAVTQQNAALVEQAAAAAAAMQEQASQLTHVVSVFRLAA